MIYPLKKVYVFLIIFKNLHLKLTTNSHFWFCSFSQYLSTVRKIKSIASLITINFNFYTLK